MVLLSQASASSWTSGDAVDAETQQKDAAELQLLSHDAPATCESPPR